MLPHVERQVMAVREAALNARGRACGLDRVRGEIVGCINATLPETLRQPTSPDRSAGDILWGPPDAAGRETALLGMLHACRAAGMEVFLTEPPG